jgi:hypothetical protein
MGLLVQISSLDEMCQLMCDNDVSGIENIEVEDGEEDSDK